MNRIELLPVSALRPALYNPREADTERLELVRLSLRKLVFLLPLVATLDGEILSGHQRHAVAADMGAARVPVLCVDMPEARRRSINILFNRATNDIGGCSFSGRKAAGHRPGQPGVLPVHDR